MRETETEGERGGEKKEQREREKDRHTELRREGWGGWTDTCFSTPSQRRLSYQGGGGGVCVHHAGFPQTFCDKIQGLFKDFSRTKCFFKDLDVL